MMKNNIEEIKRAKEHTMALADYINKHCYGQQDGLVTDTTIGDLQRLYVLILETMPYIQDKNLHFRLEEASRQLKLKIRMTVDEMEN